MFFIAVFDTEKGRFPCENDFSAIFRYPKGIRWKDVAKAMLKAVKEYGFRRKDFVFLESSTEDIWNKKERVKFDLVGGKFERVMRCQKDQPK